MLSTAPAQLQLYSVTQRCLPADVKKASRRQCSKCMCWVVSSKAGFTETGVGLDLAGKLLLTHDLAPNFLNCGSWFTVRVVKTFAAAYDFYTCDDQKLTQNQIHNESKLFLEVLICVEQCFTVALLLNKKYVLLNTQVMPKNLAFKHRHTNRLLYTRTCSVFNVRLKYSALIGIWRLNFGKQRLLIFLYLYAPNI